jgi:hypothetical protein
MEFARLSEELLLVIRIYLGVEYRRSRNKPITSILKYSSNGTLKNESVIKPTDTVNIREV